MTTTTNLPAWMSPRMLSGLATGAVGGQALTWARPASVLLVLSSDSAHAERVARARLEPWLSFYGVPLLVEAGSDAFLLAAARWG